MKDIKCWKRFNLIQLSWSGLDIIHYSKIKLSKMFTFPQKTIGAPELSVVLGERQLPA